jgi:SNF2 family DNA or RNA helicase
MSTRSPKLDRKSGQSRFCFVTGEASGKWDLYQEVLQEALDSGQKVVVFSQFLGMIELMERRL